jgi:hypothetical protein
MQIEVTGPVVTSAGENYHNKMVISTFTLKCWEDGVDKKVVPPVINQEFSYQQKTEAEDKTTDELAKRVEEKAKIDMQKTLDGHGKDTYEESFGKDARVIQMASNIQGALS